MEQSFLAWLRGRQHALPQVAVGIGDDAAILDWPEGQLVLATDAIVDGVDFLSNKHSLRAIGHKSLAINLSDLAAMGAEPVAMLVNLSLPEENATQTAAEVYEGILQTAADYKMAIAGGDITVYRGPLAISITVIGRVAHNGGWLRGGAEVGDAVIVTGAFGGSILGRHLNVRPRVREALAIRELVDVHAAIDVSDGLSLDLDRLCAASGVGAELDLSAIPVHEDATQLAAERQTDALRHALGDGEDFELILAIPADQVPRLLQADVGVPLTQIGTYTARTGMWFIDQGRHVRLSPSGYVHGGR